MILTALAAATFQQGEFRQLNLPNPNITVRQPLARLEPAKLSPKLFDGNRWEFDWITWGFGNITGGGEQQLRIRVFSQERKEEGDKAPLVARMVMQLWNKTFRTLKFDHPNQFNSGIVDFYLCFGGEPGGEQLFGEEILPNRPQPVKVNTIYIYQLHSFKEPVEMAREVAHEYGHAILPGIGGFKQPEVFSNGYLGEKLFLKWMRDGIAASRSNPDAPTSLSPLDAMGAPLERLDAWVTANVDPLVKQAATRYPDGKLINESRGGMDAFLGLALYMESAFPPALFTRSLAYVRDAHGAATDNRPPTDYPEKILAAAAEMEQIAMSVPPSLKGVKSIWIPLGKGQISGGTVLTRREGWAEVAPLLPTITIKNPPIH